MYENYNLTAGSLKRQSHVEMGIVASYLLYVPQFFRGIDLGRWPNVVTYMKRCAEREAYGQAFGPDVQNYLVSALDQMGKEKKKMFGVF